MIGYDFRMHQARVFLCRLLVIVLMLACRAVAMRRRVIVLVGRTIGVNRPYLRARSERACADQNKNLFCHFVGQALRLQA